MSRGVRGVARRRWLRRTLLAVGVLFVAWLVACLPGRRRSHGQPRDPRRCRSRCSGPPSETAGWKPPSDWSTRGMPATSLSRSTRRSSGRPARVCARPPTGVSSHLFHRLTRQPRRARRKNIRRLAAAQHWNTIIVVTSTYHVSRARLIIEPVLRRHAGSGGRPRAHLAAGLGVPVRVSDRWLRQGGGQSRLLSPAIPARYRLLLPRLLQLSLFGEEPDRAGDAGAAESAVAVGVLGQVLLVVVLGVVELAGRRRSRW